jgi:putative colanic acid biosynthesis UDP-glucose lipid carrier transferase
MRTGYHKIGIGAGAIALLQRLTLPVASFATLYACIHVSMYVYNIPQAEEYAREYLALGLIAALLAYIFSRPQPSELSGTIVSGWTVAEKLTMAWIGVVATLLLLGYLTKVSSVYSRRVLIAWFVLTPAFSIAIWIFLRTWLRHIFLRTGTARTVVVAGINRVSRRLTESMRKHPEYGLQFKGFFEDRSGDRLGDSLDGELLGKLRDLPDYVRRNNIDTIFIAIPISHVERTQILLDDLKDTTASIYFVPDIFVVDLIQSRSDEVSGIHVLALCETPFYGWRAVLKRLSDIVLASTMLLLAAPAMLAIAAAIKITTKDKVFFKQRRYGLGGEEIIVYKFRTMTTSDDGDQVKQASVDDARVTPVGRFLRRYSLDELPQLINVLQGRMSVVGPRPHAVAHNEEYRKLIKGYMVRHKVSPGITGLAQVSGCRGETATVEDMERRIHYDIKYLREWSLGLDLKILTKTVTSMLGDKQAY